MATTAAPERDRSAVADKYKWNLADLYPSEDAWRAEKTRITAELPALRAWRGQLTASAAQLAAALEKRSELRKVVVRLAVYADMLSDQDTRDSTHQGMTQEMTQLGAALNAESSYMEPEILRADRSAIEAFIAGEPRLADYAHELRDILRRAAHTLSDAEEKLLADIGPLAAAPSSIYNILSNADFPYPLVTLSDGRTAKVNHARYTELRALPNRADRQAVQSAYFECTRRIPSHLRHDDGRAGSEGAVLLEGTQVRIGSRVRARFEQRAHVGLHAAHRGDRPQPADLPPLPGPSQANARSRPAALLRPVRAAGRLGGYELQPRGRRAGHRRGDGAAGAGIPDGRVAGVQRTLDRHVRERRQALRCVLAGRGVRRAPVHPDELQRQVRRREHAGPRVGPHDAELPVEQAPAVPHG